MNQWGSGASHYSLTETSRRYIQKFGTTGVDYLLRVEPFNVRGLKDVLKGLDELFVSILSDMTRGMADRDQVRFVMHSPQLNNPISLPFMPLRRIMFEVERVLQSHEEFTISNDLHINFIHVKMPSGSGNGNRKRRSGRAKPFLWGEFTNTNATETLYDPFKTKMNCVPHEPLSQPLQE